jgi:hypothetical protein
MRNRCAYRQGAVGGTALPPTVGYPLAHEHEQCRGVDQAGHRRRRSGYYANDKAQSKGRCPSAQCGSEYSFNPTSKH